MPLPTQTKYIVGNEACERFSFYGMRSILTLYMTGVLAMSQSAAVTVSHLFNACIYVLPLFGAWLADRFLGRYRMILWVSLFYCLGHGVLATADLTDSIETRRYILFAGLFIIALGAGGIKPCVSAFVGDQVEEGESKTMTRIYAAFYWSINLGSFFSFLIIPWVRQNWGYSWAFGIPGIFMALATFIFWRGRRFYRHRQPTQPEFFPLLITRLFCGSARAVARFGEAATARARQTLRGVGTFAIAAVALLAVLYALTQGVGILTDGLGETVGSLCCAAAVLLALLLLAYLSLRCAAHRGSQNILGIIGALLLRRADAPKLYTAKELRDTRNLLRVLVVFLMIIPFWSLFDQTMSSWVLQGEKMRALSISTAEGMSFEFGAEEMQSFNPLLVMILVPLVTLLIYPRIGKWGTPLRRMGCGIVLAGISYGAVAGIQAVMDTGVQLSILWQCLPYFLLTCSEILVSTTGLEYAYTAAGKHLKSIIAGFWYLTSTLGNFLVIYLTHLVADPASTSTFLIYGILSILIGLIFLRVTTRPAMQPEAE